MADFRAMLEAKKLKANPATDGCNVRPEIIEVHEKIAKEETAATLFPKSLTFAEKMALKKSSVVSTHHAEIAIKSPDVSDTLEKVESFKIEEKQDDDILRTGLLKEIEIHNQDASTETIQAYLDVRYKIEHLESLQDVALEGAMKELKIALLANPNAVELMFDTDFGKMAIALMKLKNEAFVEAANEKTTRSTKKTKNTPLTAESLAAVFDEL